MDHTSLYPEEMASNSYHFLRLFMGCSTIPNTFTPHPISPESFTHETFHQALIAHVKNGVVDYPSLAHNSNFNHYMNLLQHIAPQQLPTPNHRLAFWINAYNAFALEGILDGYSPATSHGTVHIFYWPDIRGG